MPVTSLFTAKTNSTGFRLRWRGYDPGQVDEFLRQTSTDRRQLEEGLAQLEAIMGGHSEERRREFERLAALRAEIAGCLETSIGALRTATELLSKTPIGSVPQRQGSEAARRAPTVTPQASAFRFRWSKPAWMTPGRVRALVASASLVGVIPVTLMYQSGARENAPQVSASAPPVVAVLPAVSEPEPAPAPVVEAADGLVLTLTASRDCWLGTRIDGGQPLERLLKAGETIMVRANNEAVLRVGDAAALSVLINNELAKPLGASGQVVTKRITRANYLTLLTQN
jgi:DivIVA domain-containing protein